MGQADDAIAFATAQIGKPYKFGASGPNSYDCSGLIVAAYAAANPPIHLVHFTGAMIGEGSEVARSDLGPGDLVFPDSGHVQLYLGNNQVIEAPHDGANVRIVNMYGFWRGRRVAAPSTGQGGPGAGGGTGATPVSFNPLDATKDTAKFIGKLVDPTFWKLAGMFTLGGLLVVSAVIYLMRHKIASGLGWATQAASTAGNLYTKPLEVAVLKKTLATPDAAPAPAVMAPVDKVIPAYKPRHYERTTKVGERTTVAVSKGSKTYMGKRSKGTP